ncbi:helix-turn-helix domain-containing protein [Thermoleptolyngbya sichuanensis]|nr:helix-turn-helix domain-containing protein [Thermoleptolyngbya sichuanensis]
MRPYSLDLRQKIIDVYIEGNTSQRQIAQQFRVAYSFVRKLIKQYRETGEIAPKRRTEQTPTKLSNEQLEILKTIAESNHDATLAELCDLLEQRVGCKERRNDWGAGGQKVKWSESTQRGIKRYVSVVVNEQVRVGTSEEVN